MTVPRDPREKILDRSLLASRLSRGARGEKTLALANGCFDILHLGHARYLKEAGECGDILLVAVNSDSSVRKLKGENRPVVGEKERALLIAAFEAVDFVVVFEEADVRGVIREVQPDFHCKGGDYREENVPERDEVERNGGVVRIVGGGKLRSSSDLIGKVTR